MFAPDHTERLTRFGVWSASNPYPASDFIYNWLAARGIIAKRTPEEAAQLHHNLRFDPHFRLKYVQLIIDSLEYMARESQEYYLKLLHELPG